MNKSEAKEWLAKTCGEGWLPLLEEVYERLPSNITIIQTFQKWGALKFECTPWDEEFEAYLDDIAERSLGICEKCGEVGSEKTIDGWIYTRCDQHGNSAIEIS